MTIGIIGGSGLYDVAELADREEKTIATPFGDPSGPYITGTLRGKRVAFLARHGAGHRLTPSELNFRANIYGLKTLGVEYILSASAVGSLKEEYKPADILIPDQFFDRTKGRPSTFFGRGLVGHVAFAHPFCRILSGIAYDSGKKAGATIHKGGTYVCMEGPQFSTRAESQLHRSWGADVIGMTAATEAKLCRETEVCFTSLALVTDYDAWHATEDAVSVEAIIAVLRANVAGAQEIIRRLGDHVAGAAPCTCARAAAHAVITAPDAISAEARGRLRLLHGRDS